MWVRPRRMRDCWTDSQGQSRRLAIPQSPAFIHVDPVIFDHISHLIICLREETLPSYSLRKHAEMIATTPSHLDPDSRNFYVIFILLGYFSFWTVISGMCKRVYYSPEFERSLCVASSGVGRKSFVFFINQKHDERYLLTVIVMLIEFSMTNWSSIAFVIIHFVFIKILWFTSFWLFELAISNAIQPLCVFDYYCNTIQCI